VIRAQRRKVGLGEEEGGGKMVESTQALDRCKTAVSTRLSRHMESNKKGDTAFLCVRIMSWFRIRGFMTVYNTLLGMSINCTIL